MEPETGNLGSLERLRELRRRGERLYFCDLHIHGKYSRATSARMNIQEISRFARIKGLKIVGTGDFTHPMWFRELKEGLGEVDETGLYIPKGRRDREVYFLVTGEVSTIFEYQGEVKKIHHLILVPNLEVAQQVNDRLARYGDLSSDGRPTLDMSAPELVEEVMEVSAESMIIPAHIWTPWFSLFGAFSGFDSIEDCYQDQTKNIHAVETGLSSDPPMNWRLSSLDRYTLVSNSDSHSPWPWRIGREANAFVLYELTYRGIVDAIMRKGVNRVEFTIETDPSYGKYHWTGHRRCGVSMSPIEAIKVRNVCPVCGRKLTKGVSQRVEELADRPDGFKPKNVPGYIHLLPLSEIIQVTKGYSSPNVRQVWSAYSKLIDRFGDEYTVLMEAPAKEIAEATDSEIAGSVISVREGRVKITPGYDGVYGKIDLLAGKENVKTKARRRGTLDDFL